MSLLIRNKFIKIRMFRNYRFSLYFAMYVIVITMYLCVCIRIYVLLLMYVSLTLLSFSLIQERVQVLVLSNYWIIGFVKIKNVNRRGINFFNS